MEIGIPTFFSESASSFNFNNLNNSICNYIAYEKNYVSCEVLDMGAQFISGIILQEVFKDILHLLNFNVNDLIVRDVPNEKFALYGVGIGELFLCVGMWVGAFAITLTYDRKKRVSKLSSTK
jgi:putative membrane protein